MKIEINIPTIRLPRLRAKKKEREGGRLSKLRRPEYEDVIGAATNTLALIAVIMMAASIYLMFTFYGEYNDNQAVFSLAWDQGSIRDILLWTDKDTFAKKHGNTKSLP